MQSYTLVCILLRHHERDYTFKINEFIYVHLFHLYCHIFSFIIIYFIYLLFIVIYFHLYFHLCSYTISRNFSVSELWGVN